MERESRWTPWIQFRVSRTVFIFRTAVWLACVGFSIGSGYTGWVAAAALVILGGGMVAAQRVGYARVNRWSLMAETLAVTAAIRLDGGLASSAFVLYGGLGILMTVYGAVRWAPVSVATILVLYGWATDFPWTSQAFWFRAASMSLFVIAAGGLGEAFVRREHTALEARRRLEQLESLRAMQEGLLREEPLEVLLDALLAQAVSLVGADAGYIATLEPPGRLRVRAAAGTTEAPHLFGWDAGAAEPNLTVVTTGRRVLVNDDQLAQMGATEAARWGWRGMAVAPLYDGTRLLGLLALAFRDPVRAAAQELTLVDSLAALAAGQIRYDAERTAARKRGRLLQTLDRVGKLVNSNLRMQNLLPVLHQTVADELHTDSFFVLLTTETPLQGYMAYLYDDGQAYEPTVVPLTPDSPTMQVLESGEPRLWTSDPAGASTIGSDRSVAGMLVAPLSRESRVIGVISAQSYRTAFDRDQLEFLSAVANQAAIAIENAQLYQHAEEVAMTDSMTGLGNARRLAHVGDEVVRQAREDGRPLSVLLIDSDSLKVVNDRYGHGAGDAHVQHLARAIRHCIRSGDHAFRYAGDEFVVVLVDTPAAAAAKVAERIREEVAAGFEWDGRQLRDISVSVGVAELRAGDRTDVTMETLFSRADALMYEAKRAGKNRVAVGS